MFSKLSRLAIASGILLAMTNPAAAYTFTNIADTSGQFNLFQDNPISINDNGIVAFRGILDDGNDGIYTGNGSTLTTIADRSGQFSGFEFGAPTINNSGLIVFKASLDNGSNGIYTSNGTTTTLIFQSTSSAPFFIGGYPDLNENGAISFQAANFSAGQWIYRTSGGSLTTIADNAGILSGFSGDPVINDSGTVAFWALLDSGGQGIFIGNGSGSFQTIADSSGYTVYNPPSINNSGTVAFTAIPNTGIGKAGIYTSNGTTISTYIDPSSPFSVAGGKQSLNDNGNIAFLANVGAPRYGIFIGPDPIADKVIERGDTLFGSTVIDVQLWNRGLNNNGQLAFYASLADGRQVIVRADPSSGPTSVPEPSGLFGVLLWGGWGLFWKSRLFSREGTP
jgi:hypothetical protein